jgi:hypothetical protein
MKLETSSSDAVKFALWRSRDKAWAVKGASAPANSCDSRVLPFSVLVPFFLVILAIGQSTSQSSKGAPSPAAHAPAAPSSDPSKYVGAETCKTCHEEIYDGWEKSPHWKTTLNKEASPSKLCLQCHTFPTQGPAGPAHNQSAKYQTCTMCHAAIHGSNFSNVFFK